MKLLDKRFPLTLMSEIMKIVFPTEDIMVNNLKDTINNRKEVALLLQL